MPEQQPAARHTTQMRKVRDVAFGSAHAKCQFDDRIERRKYPSVHRDRRNQRNDRAIRKQGGVSEKQTKHPTGSAKDWGCGQDTQDCTNDLRERRAQDAG